MTILEPLSKRRWRSCLSLRCRLFIVFSGFGLFVTLLNVGYLWLSYPARSPVVTSISDRLCPSSFLTAIYMDVPGTITDHIVTWVEVSVLNAGLYGVLGEAIFWVLRVGRFIH